LPATGGVANTNASEKKSAGAFAYMLFTSGSTGKPKGVPITHQNVQNYVENINRLMQFSPNDRFTNTFDLTFDLSIHDMFISWSNAAALYCIAEKSLMAPARFLKKNKISCWFSVPSVANVMKRLRMLKDNAFPDMRYALFCGEPLLHSLAEKWQEAAPNAKLFNIYGPTEATIGISSYTIPKKGIKSLNGMVSIGRLFLGNEMKIADETFNDAGEGELLLSGRQLIAQYWNNPDKSKEAFTVHNGVRWYHTGDIVKKDSDGDLFFVERKDFQVKIQGYRVELNEIDYVVSRFTGTEEVRTIVVTGSNQMNKLVTCIVKPPTKSIEALDVIAHCRNTLPAYMVPESIAFFSSFPRNQNGKTNIRELHNLIQKENTQQQ
jgi:acyl-coenzyme A synthetase/AMP-(fatty) acid ligase